MANIGDGTSFVALLPGALEELVSNIRGRFAPLSHSHGTTGIEDGAVTEGKLSAGVAATLGRVRAENLSPFFSVPWTSTCHIDVTGSDGVTTTHFSATNGYWHTLPDLAWSRDPCATIRYFPRPSGAGLQSQVAIACSNQTDAEATATFAPVRDGRLPEGTPFTLLVEWESLLFGSSSWRDSATGSYVTHDDYATEATITLAPSGDSASEAYQFQDSDAAVTLREESGSARLNLTTRDSYGETGASGTVSYEFERLVGLVVSLPPHTIWSALLRVSLYEGDYDGPYVEPAAWSWAGALSGSRLADGSVAASKLASSSVTAEKLASDAVELVESAARSAASPATLYDATSDGDVEVTSTAAIVPLSGDATGFGSVRVTWATGASGRSFSADFSPSVGTSTLATFVDCSDDCSRMTMRVLEVALGVCQLTVRVAGSAAIAGEEIPLAAGNTVLLKSVEGW